MTTYSEFYEEKLYPFQNSILKTIEKLSLPFYLTGGTTISRFYYHHRYSDDLDFFVNSEENFPDYVAKALSAIQEMNEVEIKTEELQLSPGYVSLPVRFLPDGTNMKIDFVNDLPYHVGAYKKDVLFNKIDSIDNILANKITAIIGRTETKDIVDLWTICNHHGFFWNTAIDNAFQKEANIDIAFISASLGFISKKEFEDIKWIQKPNWETFKNDLQIIVGDMINLSKNSLY